MKQNIYTTGIAVLLALLLYGPLAAQLRLPFVLGSNMVLQRDRPVPVWGYAAAGEQVTVQFNQQVKKTVTDASGKWRVDLDPLAVSTRPAEMIISTKDSSIRLQNILVGEVWLCSGQSNMEYSMRKNSKFEKALHGNAPANELDSARNPLIRIFLVRNDYSKLHPVRHTWDSATGVPLRDFSAAGYFFAKELYRQLGVPVGIISASVSGSRIEPWLPHTVQADQHDSAETGKFYTTMISPLAPFLLRGFLWYQGESNCFLNDTVKYTAQMQTLIDSWRGLWHNNSLPFYYVQLPPYYYSHSTDRPHTDQTLAQFRHAQALVLSMPHTGMIVTTDLVDSPDDLHPAYKWEIGRRLALLALATAYDRKIEYSGPVFRSMKTEGNTLVLSFDHTGSGLVSNDGKPLNWFSIAGSDGNFVAARAVIKNNTVIVSAPGITQPAAVQFGWNETAQPNLFNKEGFPTAPFNTLEQLVTSK
ncbi:MAG TPA: sialate O-acetylesterase [Chitinophagaceae bacterium]|jgi:sialate O-acetylesterase